MPSVAPGAVRLDVEALRRAMRRHKLDAHDLAFACDVPRRCVRRAVDDGECTAWLLGELSDVLGTPPGVLTGELTADE